MLFFYYNVSQKFCAIVQVVFNRFFFFFKTIKLIRAVQSLTNKAQTQTQPRCWWARRMISDLISSNIIITSSTVWLPACSVFHSSSVIFCAFSPFLVFDCVQLPLPLYLFFSSISVFRALSHVLVSLREWGIPLGENNFPISIAVWLISQQCQWRSEDLLTQRTHHPPWEGGGILKKKFKGYMIKNDHWLFSAAMWAV